MIKHALTYIILFISTSLPAIEIEGNKLIDKANKHIENMEWKEASALYDIIISQEPDSLNFYAPAIVASAKTDNYNHVVEIVVVSEKNGIALDSILNNILIYTTKLGDTNIYEKTLLSLQKKQPWFEKLFNKHLLEYYKKRHYNTKAIEIADHIIKSKPANIKEIMAIKANCFNELGDIDSAAIVMREILAIDNNFYDARIYLGNYYYLKAIQLIENRAEEIDEKEICSLLQQTKEFIDIEYLKAKSPYVRDRLKEIDKLCNPKEKTKKDKTTIYK